jgi:hypothetical protein
VPQQEAKPKTEEAPQGFAAFSAALETMVLAPIKSPRKKAEARQKLRETGGNISRAGQGVMAAVGNGFLGFGRVVEDAMNAIQRGPASAAAGKP